MSFRGPPRDLAFRATHPRRTPTPSQPAQNRRTTVPVCHPEAPVCHSEVLREPALSLSKGISTSAQPIPDAHPVEVNPPQARLSTAVVILAARTFRVRSLTIPREPGKPTPMPPRQPRQYYVYIMTSASRNLYVGVTNDLMRRVYEHKRKRVPGFTRKYNVTQLAYFEETDDITAAIAREKQIKGWRRFKKVSLIHSANPDWKDLSSDWFDHPYEES